MRTGVMRLASLAVSDQGAKTIQLWMFRDLIEAVQHDLRAAIYSSLPNEDDLPAQLQEELEEKLNHAYQIVVGIYNVLMEHVVLLPTYQPMTDEALLNTLHLHGIPDINAADILSVALAVQEQMPLLVADEAKCRLLVAQQSRIQGLKVTCIDELFR